MAGMGGMGRGRRGGRHVRRSDGGRRCAGGHGAGEGEDGRVLSGALGPQGWRRSISADAFGGEPGSAAPVQPVVRTNFADTAYWAAALTTAADGTAEVEFPLPESLTTWKVKTWTMGPGTRVGQGETEIITTKDLLVRLQAPRFFVQKDEVVLSANVHNKLKTKKSVQVVLEFEGSVLQLLDSPSQTVEIAAGGEHRVDWRVKVAHEGQAVIRMKALTDEESDAAQMTFPAYVHGMLKMEAFAGAIRPDQDKAQVVLRVPAERRPEQSRLEVRYSPTLAGALVDALPYLADYPYGCTEQTLNRFLPTVITQKVLINLGVDLKAIRDKRTNLNAQELGDAKERAKRWKGYEHNAVFDLAEVAKMAAAGVQRLADMQLSDGGWGWFSGYGEYASPHTTALVVHGLQVARQNDLALPQGMLERGVAWLTGYQAKQVQLLQNGISEIKPYKKAADDLDALVFMVLADGGVRNDAMLAFLDRDRTHLSVYAKAMFGLALEKLGEKDKLAMVLQNIRQYVVRGRREPDGLPQAAQRGLLVVVVRQRDRDRRVLPQAAGPDRPQGRARLAAGQVRAQQPQARQLLELDPRHGLLHRGPGRLPQGQRRGPARHDGGDRPRRPDAQGSEDHAGRPLQLRQRAGPRGQGRGDGRAHGLLRQARARARSTSTPT